MQKNALSIGCAASLLLWCAAPASAQTPPPMKNLNDTGVSGCVVALGADLAPCDAANAGDAATVLVPRQDARTGRDAAQTIGVLSSKPNNTGAAGFQYTRILLNGTAAAPTANPGALANAAFTALVNRGSTPATPTAEQNNSWACTRDEVTGLTWTIESFAAPGTIAAPGGTATDPAINGATNYNTLAVCGFNSGWRLPTRRELLSLVNNGVTGAVTVPRIDATFFPNTVAGVVAIGTGYWASETVSGTPANSWQVYFANGTSAALTRAATGEIRLVRSPN